MRYDKYLNRINKLNKVINGIYRLRFVLASVASVTLVGVLTFEFTKGIVKLENFDKVEFVYGDIVSASSSAFANYAEVEYREVSQDEWNKEAPIYPGNYQVRGVSKNGFGSKTTSDPIDFTIRPKDVEVSISESQITYGDLPHVSASLFGIDKISTYKVKYDDEFTNKTKAVVDKKSVVIVDKEGKDVSFCYNITAKERELDVLPRSIFVSFADNEKLFDEKTIKQFDGEITQGNLAADDVISYKENEEQYSAVGEYTYQKDIKIMRGDKDVTHMYNIKTNTGHLKISKIPLTAYSLTYENSYNGKTLLENDAYRVKVECPNLVEGHKVNIAFEGDYETYKDSFKPLSTESIFSIRVTDKDDNDVTGCYDISKTFASIEVSTRDISIAFGSESKYFDGVELVNKQYSVGGDLLDNDVVKVDPNDEDLFPKVFEPDTVSNIVSSVQITNPTLKADVTDCYVIDFIPGILEVKKPHLVFDMLSFGEIEYDGKKHSLDEYKLNDSSDEISSDTFRFKLANETNYAYRAQEEPYYSYNSIDVYLNSNDFRVTDFFDIDYNRAESIIKPKKINPYLYFADAGSPNELTYNKQYHEVKVGFNGSEIVDGENFILNNNSFIKAGTYSLAKDMGYNIISPEWGDVTDCYEFDVLNVNSLVINKKNINVSLPTFGSVEYDSDYHYASLNTDQFVGDNALCDGDSIYETNPLEAIDAGQYDYKKDFVECSDPDNYKLNFNQDSVESKINKKAINIEFEGINSTYDGTSRYIKFKLAEGQSLASNDEFAYSTSEGNGFISDKLSIRNAGTYTRSSFKDFFDNGQIKIVNKDTGNDVSNNYIITDNFDETSFVINKCQINVTLNNSISPKIYNGQNYVFNEYTVDPSTPLPSGHSIKIANAFTAKHAGVYTLDDIDTDNPPLVNVYFNESLENSNFDINIINGWSPVTINKKDITIKVHDFNPTYNGKGFSELFKANVDSIVDFDGDDIYEEDKEFVKLNYSYKNNPIFIGNDNITSLRDLVNIEIVDLRDEDNVDYNLVVDGDWGNCVFNKREIYFKGVETTTGKAKNPVFIYNQSTPSLSVLKEYVVSSGDKDFFDAHEVIKDDGAVKVRQDSNPLTGIAAGTYNFECDASKFHLYNLEAGGAPVDDYVHINFQDLDKKLVIGKREVHVIQQKHQFKLGDFPKANEKFKVDGLCANEQVYLVVNGKEELVDPNKTDYESIIDMTTVGGHTFKIKGADGKDKEITNAQFKVFNSNGDDMSYCYNIIVDKDPVKRGCPVWINE